MLSTISVLVKFQNFLLVRALSSSCLAPYLEVGMSHFTGLLQRSMRWSQAQTLSDVAAYQLPVARFMFIVYPEHATEFHPFIDT
jgi:hypothetical protein